MTREPDDIEALYHAFLTGFILTLVTRAGPRQPAESTPSWPVQALP